MLDFFGLMGPLDKSWCDLFLLFGVISVIVLIVNFIMGLYDLAKEKDKLRAFAKFILQILYPFLFYIIYRMLYQLCIKTL